MWPLWRAWASWWAVFAGDSQEHSDGEPDPDDEVETRVEEQMAMHVNDIDPESPACRFVESDGTESGQPGYLDWCPACGGDLDEPSVPEGYSRAHCLSCAQEIDRRSLDRERGGGLRV